MNTIENENYKITYDYSENKITFSGTLRLSGLVEYAPVIECLQQGVEQCESLTLVIKDLEFLNSSGIAVLSKFVISARNKAGFSLSIIGSDSVPWQGKSLNNLQRLMPDLKLILD
jgi:hypothetical protein